MSNFTWTWMKGSDTPQKPSNYGMQGVPADSNIPGSRGSSFLWTGNDGLFYLFGGQGSPNNGFLNDLWQYNPATNQWVWLAGSSDANRTGTYNAKGFEASSSYPGARRNGATWVTSDGKRYLFGGRGFATTPGADDYLNDLWRYNNSTNQWAWVHGGNAIVQVGQYGTKNVPAGTNTPGGREGCVSWVGKDGQLYLFGGYGYGKTTSPTGHLNDLWSFNPATSQWTWIGGSDGIGQFGVYGTPNVPAPTNFPGARISPVAWSGTDDYLYLFGGSRRISDAASATDQRNDLWRFNISDKQWTWINGSSSFDQNGVYGTQNVPASGNTPGSRDCASGWVATSGQLFLFGGFGFPETGVTRGKLDDLWMFDPPTNKWVWIKGSKLVDQPGSYGSQGVPSDANNPRAREFDPGIWISNVGAIYLFGGFTTGGDVNDLWRGTMPCDLKISDLKTFPSVVAPGQKFHLIWTVAPTIFPLNYQAIVTFNGSDTIDYSTSFTDFVVLTAPDAEGSYPAQLRVIQRNSLNCSDVKSMDIVVTKPTHFSSTAVIAQLPYLLLLYILLYMGVLGFFLFNIISEY